MFPGHGLHGPFAVGIFLPKHSGQFAEHCVIVCRLVVTDAFPVERFGRGFRISKTIQHRCITPLCVNKVFAHESDARQTHLQVRAKLVDRKITLDAIAFLSVWIEYEHGWRPERVEPVEVSGMFLDVCFKWHEVVVDEGSGFVVVVGFGFQPRARASSRSSAEIDQQRFLVCLRLRERRVGVFHPVNFHVRSSSVR